MQEEHIKLVKNYIKLKLLADNRSYRSDENKKEQIYDIIKETVESGQSKSCVITGPRGCGKTTLLNSVLDQISSEVDMANNAVLVKLHGWLHNDSRTAVKSISVQLELDNTIEDRVFGTAAESVTFLLSSLSTDKLCRAKSIVFILDEIDMFLCDAKMKNLLYSLLDVIYSEHCPMCFIAISCRANVLELLDKRARSRFSNTQITLQPAIKGSESKDDMQSRLEACKCILLRLLCLPQDIAKEKTQNSKHTEHALPSVILDNYVEDYKKFKCLTPALVKKWNNQIKNVFNESTVEEALLSFCYETNSEQTLRTILFRLVCGLNPSKPYIEARDFVDLMDKTLHPNEKVLQLLSLSVLELSLVIAIKHYIGIHGEGPINFEIIFDRYSKFINSNSSIECEPRNTIMKAFENLQLLNIVTQYKSSGHKYALGEVVLPKTQKEFELFCLSVTMADVTEAIKKYKALPTEIRHWFDYEVV